MHTHSRTLRIATVLAPAAVLARSAGAWAEPALIGTGADDDPPAAHVAPPHAGSWTLGFRYPWDVQRTPDGVAIGTGGVGIAIGARVTDRIYLGVSADAVAITREPPHSGEPATYDRLRAGLEARWYFHDGLAFAAPGEEAWMAPRHDWLGVRWGAEAEDDSAQLGRFAEAALGTDISYGTIGMAVSLAAGVSRSPGAPIGAATMLDVQGGAARAPGAPPVSAATSPYVGFTLALLFQ